jgi:hypothetical protein
MGAQNVQIRSGDRPIKPECPVDQIGGSELAQKNWAGDAA